jgi:phosphoglycolate phosphatase-like HAD superfamily hydrolase
MSSTLNIRHYKTIVFDCDGVILDSNQVKTQAFHAAALPWGQRPASDLVDYHVNHGGISRYKKFDHFLRHIVGKNPEEHELTALLDAYAREVRAGLRTCALAQGLRELRNVTPDARWMVVSGGDQNELREVFAERKVADLFDGGIYGSPDTKDTILAREAANGKIVAPAVFLGDSRYDHEAATRAVLDFIFVSGWTEFRDWQAYFLTSKATTVTSLQELLRKTS